MVTTIKERTNKQLVLEAIEDLHRQEQVVTREALEEFTGLKRSIIDDRVKALKNDGCIITKQRGVYEPIDRHPPARHISMTMLPDGWIVLDIGDDVVKCTPREARMVATALSGVATHAVNIEQGTQAAYIANDLASQVRSLERRLEQMMSAQAERDTLQTA